MVFAGYHADEDRYMEKLFLTGGSGFIGINVMECFLKKGIQVYNYDCCNISDIVEDYFSRLPGVYHFIQGDILEREKLSAALDTSGADTVIHMAVITVTEERERSDTRHIFDVNCGCIRESRYQEIHLCKLHCCLWDNRI